MGVVSRLLLPLAGPALLGALTTLTLLIVGSQATWSAIVGVLIGLIVTLASALSLSLSKLSQSKRRVDYLTDMARGYAQGDFSRRLRDEGEDNLGTVVRAFDSAVQELRGRMAILAKDRARIEAILTGMIEGVLVVDEAGRVELANDAARRMLRVEESDLGRHYVELIRHPGVAAEVRHALNGEASRGVEFALPHQQNELLLARAAPVAGPSSLGAVVVLHDVTGLRRADRMRRDFVANVSHELRTPLTAIRGYVEALLDGPSDFDESRRFLEIVARQSLRMEQLVKDLLRLSLLDAGQEKLDSVTGSVERLLTGVISDLAPIIESRHQDVSLDVHPDANTFFGDASKLHDVFRNLVENASNYSPEYSPLALEARVNGDRLGLSVLDRGPGIPPSDLTRVFERFYRVDKARSRESGGTGLGLSIVRHLVELHGGAVEASNREGGGARFTVSLPIGRGTQDHVTENDKPRQK